MAESLQESISVVSDHNMSTSETVTRTFEPLTAPPSPPRQGDDPGPHVHVQYVLHVAVVAAHLLPGVLSSVHGVYVRCVRLRPLVSSSPCACAGVGVQRGPLAGGHPLGPVWRIRVRLPHQPR